MPVFSKSRAHIFTVPLGFTPAWGPAKGHTSIFENLYLPSSIFFCYCVHFNKTPHWTDSMTKIPTYLQKPAELLWNCREAHKGNDAPWRSSFCQASRLVFGKASVLSHGCCLFVDSPAEEVSGGTVCTVEMAFSLLLPPTIPIYLQHPSD